MTLLHYIPKFGVDMMSSLRARRTSGDLNLTTMAEVKTAAAAVNEAAQATTVATESTNVSDEAQSAQPRIYNARVLNVQLIPGTTRYALQTDVTFPSYDKDGVLGTSDTISKGARSLLSALGAFGVAIQSVCKGRPEKYDLTMMLGLLYGGATVTFERVVYPKGSPDVVTGKPTEKDMHLTDLKKVNMMQDQLLNSMRMQSLKDLQEQVKAEQQVISDPFAIQ